MKLITKLTLFITLSKLAIVLLFILTLPFLVESIADKYTNYYLEQQRDKVLEVVSRNGVDSYLQGSESYGSYTMLKEEYISLEPVDRSVTLDTIYTDDRIVEQDTLTYRVLMQSFSAGEQRYLLEVGKTTDTISQYNRPLQRIASIVLLGLIGMTLVIDLVFTRYLLKPLNLIIRSKLINRKFPFKEHSGPVQTTTSDFKYLDDSLISLMNQIHEAFDKEREFTANASHELMTPIGILQNKIENLMDDRELDDVLQERLMEMQKTVNRLKKIVRSLLLISRIDNEQFSKAESAGVYDLIADVTEEISHRLEEHQITLEIRVDRETKFNNVSRDLLFQLFYNLINNAIKYNKPHGSIRITDEMKNGMYLIRVTDTGIGIAPEELPLIFNRFKKNAAGSEGSYGLGLSIVKSIADYHGMKISAVSAPGKGTTFLISVPGAIVAG
ncbi:MAG TPA: HAMP domain-containing sensor histidine kinase [Sphingobacteriaceae bacterium]